MFGPGLTWRAARSVRRHFKRRQPSSGRLRDWQTDKSLSRTERRTCGSIQCATQMTIGQRATSVVLGRESKRLARRARGSNSIQSQPSRPALSSNGLVSRAEPPLPPPPANSGGTPAQLLAHDGQFKVCRCNCKFAIAITFAQSGAKRGDDHHHSSLKPSRLEPLASPKWLSLQLLHSSCSSSSLIVVVVGAATREQPPQSSPGLIQQVTFERVEHKSSECSFDRASVCNFRNECERQS